MTVITVINHFIFVMLLYTFRSLKGGTSLFLFVTLSLIRSLTKFHTDIRKRSERNQSLLLPNFKGLV